MKTGCETEGCPGTYYARSLCVDHYHADRRLKLGHKPRGAPKDKKIEAMVTTQFLKRLEDQVPEGDRSEFIRKAVHSALRRKEKKAEKAAAAVSGVA